MIGRSSAYFIEVKLNLIIGEEGIEGEGGIGILLRHRERERARERERHADGILQDMTLPTLFRYEDQKPHS